MFGLAQPEFLIGFSRATSGFCARVLYQPLLGCRVLYVASVDRIRHYNRIDRRVTNKE
jgi:hypothetical protein